jgi:hypothetical protein
MDHISNVIRCRGDDDHAWELGRCPRQSTEGNPDVHRGRGRCGARPVPEGDRIYRSVGAPVDLLCLFAPPWLVWVRASVTDDSRVPQS